MSHNKNWHDDVQTAFESPTERCSDCGTIVDQDEYMQHKGCCHNCNPMKLKNIDKALKAAGYAFYKQITQDTLKIVIKVDNPQTMEDLRNNFWMRLNKTPSFSQKTNEFMPILDEVLKELDSSGELKDIAA